MPLITADTDLVQCASPNLPSHLVLISTPNPDLAPYSSRIDTIYQPVKRLVDLELPPTFTSSSHFNSQSNNINFSKGKLTWYIPTFTCILQYGVDIILNWFYLDSQFDPELAQYFAISQKVNLPR